MKHKLAIAIVAVLALVFSVGCSSDIPHTRESNSSILQEVKKQTLLDEKLTFLLELWLEKEHPELYKTYREEYPEDDNGITIADQAREIYDTPNPDNERKPQCNPQT